MECAWIFRNCAGASGECAAPGDYPLRAGGAVVPQLRLRQNSAVPVGPYKKEGLLIKAVMDELRPLGFKLIRYSVGRGNWGKEKKIRSFGVVGVSDIIGCAPDGKFCALECKTGRLTLTDKQSAFLDDIKRRGGYAGVVRTVADARRICGLT